MDDCNCGKCEAIKNKPNEEAIKELKELYAELEKAKRS